MSSVLPWISAVCSFLVLPLVGLSIKMLAKRLDKDEVDIAECQRDCRAHGTHLAVIDQRMADTCPCD